MGWLGVRIWNVVFLFAWLRTRPNRSCCFQLALLWIKQKDYPLGFSRLGSKDSQGIDQQIWIEMRGKRHICLKKTTSWHAKDSWQGISSHMISARSAREIPRSREHLRYNALRVKTILVLFGALQTPHALTCPSVSPSPRVSTVWRRYGQERATEVDVGHLHVCWLRFSLCLCKVAKACLIHGPEALKSTRSGWVCF